MASIIDPTDDPIKCIVIGDQGDGKSGAIASLIAYGYDVRCLDTDNGHKILRTLLTDGAHYPYYDWMVHKGLDKDLRSRASFIPISTPMIMKTITIRQKDPVTDRMITTSEKLLLPKSAKAWENIIEQLERWKDPLLGADFGHICTWGSNCVLVLDVWTRIARQAYYNIQNLNGRLGQREEGHSHQRDVGGAQSQLRRLLELIFDPEIKCHVIVICHINRIDDSRGYAQTPEEIRRKDPSAIIEVKGYPMAVGIQLSKHMGSFFNDSLIIERSGSGRNVRRKIKSVPTTIDGVSIGAKSSVWLEPEYDISTGMAEIFAAERYQPPPSEMVDFFKNWRPNTTPRPIPVLSPVLAPTPTTNGEASLEPRT